MRDSRPRRNRRTSAGRGLAAAALLAALGALAAIGAAAQPARAAGPGSPNIVVVMTDDQNLSDMRVLPQIQRLLGDQGTTFTNNFTNYPLCCPSRATLLTGQYAHNHGVLTGSAFVDLDSSNTLPVWLRAGGYHTAHVGKYVNGYGRGRAGGPTYVPPGWSEWYAAVPDDQAVYDYELNENGTLVHYGTAPGEFKGDVLTAKAVDFVHRNAALPHPFFLSVAYTAPHSTGALDGDSHAGCDNAANPAPRHAGAFAGEPLPIPPSLDEADVSDKPAIVANMPLLGSGGVNEVTRQYRCRLASLLHVDDGVAQIIDALGRTGELERTLVVFTSDNGMLLGEHRIGGSKLWPYEESIHVPLLARGPGLPAGARVGALTVNADVTATILAAADVAPGVVQDGASLFERIAAPSATRELLIESFQPSPVHTPYAGVKTWRYLYVEYVTGERELYDHHVDPYELRNAVTDPAYAPVVEWMAARLAALRHCQGTSCRESWGEPPAPLDLDPPATRIDKHPRKRSKTRKRARRARFAFSADEPATFRCKLDRRKWRRCSSPKRTRVRARKARHRFAVVATDAAGNRDPKPARWRWRVRPRE